MPTDRWPTKPLSVASLLLDPKNPRLGRETSGRAPREIIQHLFDHDKAFDVAQSIATRGYFPNEPLLAVRENERYVVVEGNRRLAALKALQEPGLLEGTYQRRVARLSRGLTDLASLKTVPVTIAPSRKATDRQLAGRHIGTPVLPWQAENRASFILDKLAEGYDDDELRDQLGFSLAEIGAARRTRAIAEITRALPLAEEVKAKIDGPRAAIISTIERVFDSTAGRQHLRVRPDTDQVLRGTTSKAEFTRALTVLVTDVALGKESSRTLNANEDIEAYFTTRRPEASATKRGSFVLSDLLTTTSVATANRSVPANQSRPRSPRASTTVLPRDLKVRFGTERLLDIHRELTKLKREEFPNAGVVLLRVFFELAVVDYLRRTQALPEIVARLEKKNKQRVAYDVPPIRDLIPDLLSLAKKRLTKTEASDVEKALTYNPNIPFNLSDLHSFVHRSSALPTDRDILQFWLRVEPLFRMMLEHDLEAAGE